MNVFSIYLAPVSRNNGDATATSANTHTHTRKGQQMRTEREFERSIQASCVHMSINTHICIRFITISHQVADISSFRGKEGVVFGWYVDVCSSNSNGSSGRSVHECESASDALCKADFSYGTYIYRMMCVLSCSFSPRSSGYPARIIDDFLTV